MIPPIISSETKKGGGNKESGLIWMFPLPSWERARVRGESYLELTDEKLLKNLSARFTCLLSPKKVLT